MTLKTVTDSFGNDVTANFRQPTEVKGLGKDTEVAYNIYQELANAGSGLDRQNIKL